MAEPALDLEAIASRPVRSWHVRDVDTAVSPYPYTIGPGVLVTEAERDQLMQRLRAYQELIYAVESKYPDETRHQTALRYIRQREARLDAPASASVTPSSSTKQE